MAFGDLFGNMGLSGFGSGITGLIQVILIVVTALLLIGIIFWFFISRKQWNLKVEFKLPRAVQYLDKGDAIDVNNISGHIDAEWGKGSYNAKKGVVYLKRKGKKKVSMKPFTINKYLQGGNILTVIQTSAEEFEPVLPQSFLVYDDDATGEICALLRLHADRSESKAWKSSFEREAKQAFSIANLLKEYAPFLAIGLVIVLWGIQMLILYNRIK